uniref:Uncharacterized protein n=1 Tax=Cucumis melo TaxID=3656 RepID=A0A9I9CII6_CUCME
EVPASETKKRLSTSPSRGRTSERVEGEDPNESTMKVAISYISAQVPLIALASMINPWQAHLGFDLRPSWSSRPKTINILPRDFLDFQRCKRP